MGHCHLYPLHSWQDILLTFAEMELDGTTIFPPGTNVMLMRSPGEPVFAQVVGHSKHGDAHRRITYDRDGKTVLHDRASVRRLSLPRAPSPPRVYGGGAVPQGGVGDRHLVTIPQGVVGDRLPWGGERQGGGGYNSENVEITLSTKPLWLVALRTEHKRGSEASFSRFDNPRWGSCHFEFSNFHYKVGY